DRAEVDASDDEVVPRDGGGDAQRFQDFSVDRADLTAGDARPSPHLLAVVIPENPYPRNHNDLVNDTVLSRTGGDEQMLHHAALSKGSPLEPVERRRRDADRGPPASGHDATADSPRADAMKSKWSISSAGAVFTG